jgi:6-phosphogluconate dehydrogenase
MGANMTRRLLRAGHQCAVFDADAAAVNAISAEGAIGTHELEQLIAALPVPRTVWLMVPAGVVEQVIETIAPLLAKNDIIIDGGNSDYRLAIARSKMLAARGIHFIDVGTSGGVWGLERGYCLMIGGEEEPVTRLRPIFEALAPTVHEASQSDQTSPSSSSHGYLHCGAAGAGHFVKMVHNGIEYALMAAYAEGFNLLAHAGRGAKEQRIDAEHAPLGDPENYQYQLDVPAIAELWRNGSVVRSWLLDLTAQALKEDPKLESFAGRVSDSGEGRWALKAGIDLGVPMPALATALFGRFSSRDEDGYANKVLSAMRKQFGGHHEVHK